MTISQWHVPVDDETCYWYAIFTSFTEPVDRAQMRSQRLELYELPDYVPRRNKRNNYGYSVEEQRSETYTGMGHDINVHDQWAIESQGRIQDRTREHLGTTDKGILMFRRMLVSAIESTVGGGTAPMLPSSGEAAAMFGPPSIDGIGASANPHDYWRQADLIRRRNSTWASARLTA
jgi:phthalate 4,5-dioxygenase